MIKSKEVWILDNIEGDEAEGEELEYVFVKKEDNKTQHLYECEDMIDDLKEQGIKVGDEIEVELGHPKDEEEAGDYAPGLDWAEGSFIILNHKLLRRE